MALAGLEGNLGAGWGLQEMRSKHVNPNQQHFEIQKMQGMQGM